MSDPHHFNTSGNQPQNLPNATATLVLGILSIVVCFVCGIIALVISNKDMAMYRADPQSYTVASYNNIKAGRVCAIIGLALAAIGIVIYIIFIVFAVSAISAAEHMN